MIEWENVMHEYKFVKSNFVDKVNKDLEMQLSLLLGLYSKA